MFTALGKFSAAAGIYDACLSVATATMASLEPHELLKGFIVARIHVAGDSLDAVHPLHANMVYEAVDGLFAFSV